jgi:hypothetical protein
MSGTMRRGPTVAAVLATVFLAACGGAPDLPPSSQVSVSITPSTAAIRVGETVDLTGVAAGFTNPTLNWWEQDQHDAAVNGRGEEDCDNISDANRELIPSCRFGYLTGAPILQASSSTVTYHAPPTPGTYHVTFHAMQWSTQVRYESIEKRTTATITVAP